MPLQHAENMADLIGRESLAAGVLPHHLPRAAPAIRPGRFFAALGDNGERLELRWIWGFVGLQWLLDELHIDRGCDAFDIGRFDGELLVRVGGVFVP